VLDQAGRAVGEHGGHHRFTIGQRRGVGVAAGRPVYVIDKDTGRNTITIGPRSALETRSLVAHELNWLLDETEHPGPSRGRRVFAQVRAHGRPLAATVAPTAGSDAVMVEFSEPLDGVATGQAVVFYDQEEPRRVLGGGWITSREPRESGAPGETQTEAARGDPRVG